MNEGPQAGSFLIKVCKSPQLMELVQLPGLQLLIKVKVANRGRLTINIRKFENSEEIESKASSNYGLPPLFMHFKRKCDI